MDERSNVMEPWTLPAPKMPVRRSFVNQPGPGRRGMPGFRASFAQPLDTLYTDCIFEYVFKPFGVRGGRRMNGGLQPGSGES